MNKKRILHIDDNIIYINTTESMLSLENVCYDSACDKTEVYDYLDEKIPDVMIVDVMLENDYDPAPGTKLIEEINQKYNTIKLVVLTGNPDTELQEYLKPMICHYETKGSDPVAFRDKMNHIVFESSPLA